MSAAIDALRDAIDECDAAEVRAARADWSRYMDRKQDMRHLREAIGRYRAASISMADALALLEAEAWTPGTEPPDDDRDVLICRDGGSIDVARFKGGEWTDWVAWWRELPATPAERPAAGRARS